MKKPLILFGTGKIAELAYYYFTYDSEYTVCAFSVHHDYINTQDTFCNLPVVPFETITHHYPIETHSIFIALSYNQLNTLRKSVYLEAKALGYQMTSYISSRATLLNEPTIGENCFILENNTIQPFVTIGNNVTLWSGNHIGHHSVIKDHTFIASHAVISGGITIEEQCFIGVNATLRNDITIGERCVIGARSLILNDTESDGVYMSQSTVRSRVPSNRLKNL